MASHGDNLAHELVREGLVECPHGTAQAKSHTVGKGACLGHIAESASAEPKGHGEESEGRAEDPADSKGSHRLSHASPPRHSILSGSRVLRDKLEYAEVEGMGGQSWERKAGQAGLVGQEPQHPNHPAAAQTLPCSLPSRAAWD